MEKYSVQQVSELFKVSDRAIVKRCKKANIRLRNGKYLIPADILENWTESREKRTKSNDAIRTKNIVPIQVPIEVPIEAENKEVTRTENLVPIEVPIEVPMQVINQTESNEHLDQIESLKKETEQLKKDLKLLNATLRFAVDSIRDMQGKETMTETIQKMKDATKLEVVSMEQMVKKIELERKHNKKLQKEPIMNSVHFESSFNKYHKKK